MAAEVDLAQTWRRAEDLRNLYSETLELWSKEEDSSNSKGLQLALEQNRITWEMEHQRIAAIEQRRANDTAGQMVTLAGASNTLAEASNGIASALKKWTIVLAVSTIVLALATVALIFATLSTSS